MISIVRSMVTNLYGLWRLLRGDPRATEYLEKDRNAAHRSFFAALLVLPFYVVLRYLDVVRSNGPAITLEFIVIEGSAYALNWTAFLFMLYFICQLLGRHARFPAVVIAMNWSSLLLTALVFP
jgi:uncharacterized membrane protein